MTLLNNCPNWLPITRRLHPITCLPQLSPFRWYLKVFGIKGQQRASWVTQMVLHCLPNSNTQKKSIWHNSVIKPTTWKQHQVISLERDSRWTPNHLFHLYTTTVSPLLTYSSIFYHSSHDLAVVVVRKDTFAVGSVFLQRSLALHSLRHGM